MRKSSTSRAGDTEGKLQTISAEGSRKERAPDSLQTRTSVRSGEYENTEEGRQKVPEVRIPVQSGISHKPATYLNLTEDSAKEALIEARGDIFVASQLLGITALRLVRAIQVSGALQACHETTQKSPKTVSLDQLRSAVEERVALYRVVGLDALHDLATMPIDVNSAQNQVKLAAAARLAGTVEGAAGSGIEETLKELNQLYVDHAPRLRVIREKTTIETIPAERVISPAPEE